ncbi:phosphopantetheine-binding protein [Gilvimarinus chinensis]|uniref:phosphopantetheine-binding protein n=1 Tax=Gilvimarinus chinensis TaxID=396005 RepID=UPI00036AA1D5|nr:phosphopantetheine-binding protein [Gilvimarinus chinensis]
MPQTVTTELKTALKQLIIEECDKDEFTVEDIDDDAPLLRGKLELDSLDVLQICMAVKNQYGVRIEGNTAAQRALKSINTLANTIAQQSTQ